MSDISTWSPNAVDNQAPSPDGYPEGMAPGAVNDSDRETMAALRRQHEQSEWIDYGDSVTRTGNTSFTVNGVNATDRFTPERRVRCTDAGSYRYGDIVDSTYSAPDTVVNVTLDSGSLTANLTAVAYGDTNPTDSSLRELAFAKANTGLQKASTDLNINWATLTSQSNPDTESSTAAIRTGFLHYEVPLGSLAGGLPGSAVNLQCEPGTGPSREVRTTADLVILQGSGGALYPLRNISVVADISNTGLGGLDTGSPQDNTWYYLYITTDRQTVNAIWSTNRNYNVALPAGWDYLALVSAAFYEDSSSQLRQYDQLGKRITYIERSMRKDGAAAVNVWDQLTLNNYIPHTATTVRLVLGCDNSGVLGMSPYSNGRGGFYFTGSSAGDSNNFANALEVGRNRTVTADVPVIANRTVWTFSKASPVTIHVTGFSLA